MKGVLNNGLCPHWFTADSGKFHFELTITSLMTRIYCICFCVDDPDCGRLPWLFNVEVVHYKQYETLQQMSSRPPPAVIHFVSDGKPWTVLAMVR